MKKIIKYFKGVKKEFARIVWPTKKHLIKYYIATICFIIFFSLFFYLFDTVVALIMELFGN